MNAIKKKIYSCSLLLGLGLTAGISVGLNSKAQSVSAAGETQTVTYTVATTSSVTTSGNAPDGSSATFKNTYATKDQMTSGKAQTWTFKWYDGYAISSITLSMRANSSKGAGTFSLKAGTTTLASIGSATNFNKWFDNTSYGTTYRDVHVTMTNDAYAIQSGENVVMEIAATVNSLYCQSATITYAKALADVPTKATLDFAVSDAFVGVSGTLNYTMTGGSQSTLSEYSWTSSNADVLTIDPATGAYTPIAAGTTTVTLQGKDADNFEYTVAKDITVKEAYSVAEALAKIKTLGTDEKVPMVVKGIVSDIKEVNTNYGNATYSIVDSLSDTESLLIYRGLYLDGAKFTSASQIAVEDKVIVSGDAKLYNGTSELDTNNKIINHTSPKRISLSATEIKCGVGETKDITVEAVNFNNAPVYTVSFEDDSIATYAIDGNKISFTASNIGSSVVTISATEDGETVSETLNLEVVAAYPVNIYRTGYTNYTDTQTFLDGEGTITVAYTDGTEKVVKLDDEGIEMTIDGTKVSANDKVAPYNGQSVKITYTEGEHVVALNAFKIQVTKELAIENASLDADYMLVGDTKGTSGMIEYVSTKGAPTLEVISSDESRVNVTLDSDEFDAEAKTGVALFDLALAENAQPGQVTIVIRLTYGDRTETKQIPFSVRASAPVETTKSYKQITDLADLTSGNYVIGAQTSEGYVGLTTPDSNKKFPSYALNVTDGIASASSLSIFEVKKNTDGAISIKTSDGKYLEASTNTDVLLSPTEVFWTVSGAEKGTVLLQKQGSASALLYRSKDTTKTYDVFANYAVSNVSADKDEYVGLEFFRETNELEAFDLVAEFVKNNLFMDSIAIDDLGTGACRGENGLYIKAKTAWNKMVNDYPGEENLQTIFQEQFQDGYARYMAWATANGDSNPFDSNLDIVNGAHFIAKSMPGSSAGLVAIASVGALAAASFFLVHKKKKD